MSNKQNEGITLDRALDSETIILDLPDDCLIPIFNYLGILDLVSVHIACEHFQPAAEYSFQLDYKEINVCTIENAKCENSYVLNCKNRPMNHVEVFSPNAEETIKNMFKIFGKSITSLQLHERIQSPGLSQFLYAANDHCSKNLKCITLEAIPISYFNRHENLTDLGKHLESLQIWNYRDDRPCDELNKFLTIFTGLEELTISVLRSKPEPILKGIHGSLEKLTLGIYEYDITSEEISEFLKNHQRLKIFKSFGSFIPTTETLNHVSNIEMIMLDISNLTSFALEQINWIGLLQLNNLKRLEVYFGLKANINFHNSGHSSFDKTSRPKTSIETLGVNVSTTKQLTDLLSFFHYQSLKKLMVYFEHNYSDDIQYQVDTWEKIAKNSEKLNELYLYSVSSPASINVVLELVKIAKSLKYLHLCDSSISNHDVSRLAKVQKEKKSLLIVKHSYPGKCLSQQKAAYSNVEPEILKVEVFASDLSISLNYFSNDLFKKI